MDEKKELATNMSPTFTPVNNNFINKLFDAAKEQGYTVILGHSMDKDGKIKIIGKKQNDYEEFL